MLFFVKAVAAVVALATITLAADCNANTTPKQIRLAYAGHVGMAVSWNTNQKLSNPTVSFGKDSTHLNRDASSDISITYESSSTWNNHVTIDGLEPGTTYYYQPQCDTQVHSFTTAPNPGKGDPFKFAMVGDMGTFGTLGLSTTSNKGGAKNPLGAGDKTTIQSLMDLKSSYEFIWHGLFPYSDVVFVFVS